MTQPVPQTLLHRKKQRLLNGETLVVSDPELDALLPDLPGLRSLPNPRRYGILDCWIAYLTAYPSIPT